VKETNPPQKPDQEVDKEVQEILRLLACSDLRKHLAEALRGGENLPLSVLSEKVGASSPAAVHALREMAKEKIVQQDEKRNYSLTNIGEIVMRKLEKLNIAITALAKNDQFWLEHDLDQIPHGLLDKVGSLVDGEVVTSTPTDLFKVFSTYFLLIKNAKEVRGVSPIFIEDLSINFAELAEKGSKIELVMTSEVLDATLKLVDRAELSKALQTNLKLFLIERQPTAAFTVTDYFLELGFFRPDGTYDWSNELLSYSPEALEWGRELFAYYVEQAELLVL